MKQVIRFEAKNGQIFDTANEAINEDNKQALKDFLYNITKNYVDNIDSKEIFGDIIEKKDELKMLLNKIK